MVMGVKTSRLARSSPAAAARSTSCRRSAGEAARHGRWSHANAAAEAAVHAAVSLKHAGNTFLRRLPIMCLGRFLLSVRGRPSNQHMIDDAADQVLRDTSSVLTRT